MMLPNRKPTIKGIVLKSISDHYLDSRDFNGITLSILADNIQLGRSSLLRAVRALLREGKVDLLFADQVVNPHIMRRLPPESSVQLERLTQPFSFMDTCAYPSKNHLASYVDKSAYQGKPFTLMLALGEPQLAYRSFDLSVLETYRNDPRYLYRCNDISGKIVVTNEFYQSSNMAESDQVLLETFGFSYDRNHNRAAAAFLRYLADLSPEHQQIWHSKMLGSEYLMHPDYFKAAIYGEWGQGVSVFRAFLEELKEIRLISRLMDRPPLFRHDFEEEDERRKFGFLIRPTLAEYNNFVHLLDKMISDNIDRDFFRGDPQLELEHETIRKDGKVIVTQKGTLRLLEEWLNLYFHPSDNTQITAMFSTFNKIRKLRQSPAHSINADTFDQAYFKQQRELMIETYLAISTLRRIFMVHPAATGHTIASWLDTAKIWTE